MALRLTFFSVAISFAAILLAGSFSRYAAAPPRSIVMISVRVRHRQGDFQVDAAFTAGTGVTALFGPSGSGKTSLVQMIAGLTRPDDAVISFDGMVWNDTAKRIFVPPHRRRIGYVFQEGRLFPHMTARQNLLYGRFFSPKAERRAFPKAKWSIFSA